MPSNKDSKKDGKKSEASSSSRPSAVSRTSTSTVAPYATRLIRDEVTHTVSPAASSSSRPSSSGRTRPYATNLIRDVVPQTVAPTSSSSKPSSSTRTNPYARDSSSSIRDRSPPAAKSMAPPNVKSIYTNPKDAERAAKQTRYNSMNAEEKKEQDKWVQKNVFDKSAPCPSGYTWERVPGHRSDGYICNGGNHLVTDAMIADGRGGFWILPLGQPAYQRFGLSHRGNTDLRIGPYYQHKSGKCWCWAGSYEDIYRTGWGDVLTVVVPEGSYMSSNEQGRQFDEFRMENGLEYCPSMDMDGPGYN